MGLWLCSPAVREGSRTYPAQGRGHPLGMEVNTLAPSGLHSGPSVVHCALCAVLAISPPPLPAPKQPPSVSVFYQTFLGKTGD